MPVYRAQMLPDVFFFTFRSTGSFIFIMSEVSSYTPDVYEEHQNEGHCQGVLKNFGCPCSGPGGEGGVDICYQKKRSLLRRSKSSLVFGLYHDKFARF